MSGVPFLPYLSKTLLTGTAAARGWSLTWSLLSSRSGSGTGSVVPALIAAEVC